MSIARSKQVLWAAVAALAGFAAVNPAQAALFVSEKEIMRQARLEWLMIKRQTPLAPQQRVQDYVQCIAYELIDTLDEEHAALDWEVLVFDDESLNAFAMPGGKIGVFTGLLRVADTPDALAAVIGHEIAHLTEDHVMGRAKRQARADALTILGGAVTGMPGAVRDATTIAFSLPFGREQESEADVVGLEFMAEAGFDPRASMYLWKNMSSAKQGSPPEFLSTHPADDRRLDDLVKSLTPALVQYNQALEAGRRPNCQL